MNSFQTAWLVVLVSLVCGCFRTPVTSLDDPCIARLPEPSTIVTISYKEQLAPNMCGIASLCSILNYWKVDCDQQSLITKHPPKVFAQGYTIGELKSIAGKNDLHAFCLSANKKLLQEQLKKGRPVLAVLRISRVPVFSRLMKWNKNASWNHAVVVCGIYSDSCWWVMDPKNGFKRMAFGKFEKMWNANDNACLLVARKKQQ